MNTFRIKPGKLQGELKIPSSKSHTLRALVFALMAEGKSTIVHPLNSPDTEAMCVAISQLGARVEVFGDQIVVYGVGGVLRPADNVLDAGNSGIVLRFVTALAALLPTYTLITGDHSIRYQRPMLPLIEALTQLGAFAASSRMDGYAPIIVRGPLTSSHALLTGEDSQPVSALLIAASFLNHTTTLEVKNPGEKPWIDMTLHWLKKLGIQVHHENYERYHIEGGAAYKGFETTIPGDFSSASYPIAAALITGSELKLHNLDMQDVQGDKKLIEILMNAGANIEIDQKERSVTVKKSGRLKGGRIDLNDCIDMITILPVIACFSEGITEIVGAANARNKECDRIRSICSELKKMGAKIEERADGLLITPSPLKGAFLQSFGDQRMALALSVASLGAREESVIEDVDCIKKTYPNFQCDFQSLGAHIT